MALAVRRHRLGERRGHRQGDQQLLHRVGARGGDPRRGEQVRQQHAGGCAGLGQELVDLPAQARCPVHHRAQVRVRLLQRTRDLGEPVRDPQQLVALLPLGPQDHATVREQLPRLGQVLPGGRGERAGRVEQTLQVRPHPAERLVCLVDHRAHRLGVHTGQKIVRSGEQVVRHDGGVRALPRDHRAGFEVGRAVAARAQVHVLLPDRGTVGHHGVRVVRDRRCVVGDVQFDGETVAVQVQ